MMKKSLLFILIALVTTVGACQQNPKSHAEKIQSYIPENSVIAHRGTIYWAPELTEAAFRWARNSGADYVELDVHRSKDSVLIIVHDKTFRRTTDVAEVFPGRENDFIDSFTFEEIMQLDAGSRFNELRPEQALESYSGLEVLVFEDVFRIAEGKRIKRNPDGSRIYSVDTEGKYTFEYEADPADNGHRPGVYIETKVPENYPGIEEQIYDELTRIGWNPLEPADKKTSRKLYKNKKVNTGNTKGKILVQTFSRPGMVNFQRVFKGEVPLSFLILNQKTDGFANPEVRAELIEFALQTGAQFIGSNISATNDGLPREFADEIHKAGLKTNGYSFNTLEQMEKYFSTENENSGGPIVDGMITNRADLTIDFYYQKKVRKYGSTQSPQEILKELGYLTE